MFLRSELPPKTESVSAAADNDDLTSYEKKLVRRFERKQKRRARIPKLMAGIAIATRPLLLLMALMPTTRTI